MQCSEILLDDEVIVVEIGVLDEGFFFIEMSMKEDLDFEKLKQERVEALEMEKLEVKSSVLEEIPIFNSKISKFPKEVVDFALVSKVIGLDLNRETIKGQ